jgi:outer membrane protein
MIKSKQAVLSALAISTALIMGFATTDAKAADLSAEQSASGPWDNMSWMVRGRALVVQPDESNGRVGGAPANITATTSVVPELDISYFVNDNIALELILGVTPHDIKLGGAGTIVEDVWLLPPTLTLQYHKAFGAFKPYVGAGINYTAVISSNPTALIGNIDHWDGSFGLALQAGFDYAINDNWSFNLDVKKLFLNMDVDVGAARTPASVDLDPWLIGVGVGYRF